VYATISSLQVSNQLQIVIGASRGFLVGHVVPESYHGGPIALVQDGDEIVIDAEKNTIDLLVDDETLAKRKEKWVKPEPRFKRGLLYKYAQCVSDASNGKQRSEYDFSLKGPMC
jgi:dihydroxy-acid dehydratase